MVTSVCTPGIRADYVDHTFSHRSPQRVAMVRIADRWIHLRVSPKPLVTFGRDKGEMLRRRLGGADFLGVR